MTRAGAPDQLKYLADELENFTEIAKFLKPSAGDVPILDGVDIDGVSMPVNGVLGGDHLTYVDFKKRYDLDALIADARAAGREPAAERLESNKRRAGILLADVAGHRVTDALVAAMLHQAFLVGSYYELETAGEITTKLFEHIKTRFYESTNIKKLIAMIYGEITDQGKFRYISSGHTPPIVFSREYGRIMPLGADRTVSDTLIGMFPAATRTRPGHPRASGRLRRQRLVNEIELLGVGDILLLATDGLTEHVEGRFVAEELERCLDRVKERTASEICASLQESILAFGPPSDDVTFVVIKRL
jgi:serine phosphatase RsbU (regulator of sigma subunit)